MPVSVVGRSETLDQVIGRVHPKLSPAQLKALRDVTIATNPHLSETAPLVPGTVVVVPPRAEDTPPGSRAQSRRRAPSSARW